MFLRIRSSLQRMDLLNNGRRVVKIEISWTDGNEFFRKISRKERSLFFFRDLMTKASRISWCQ